MNTVQASTILYALRRLVDEIEMDRPESQHVYAEFLRDRHGGKAVPLSPDEITILASRLQSPESMPVVIIIEGGRVQNALSNAHVGVTVIDYECDGIPPEELTEVPQDDGTMSLADVYAPNVAPLSKHWADFADWWEHYA